MSETGPNGKNRRNRQLPKIFACGALIALKISGGTLNVISLLGIVLLGGVVVNNGIVLIEYMNQPSDRP